MRWSWRTRRTLRFAPLHRRDWTAPPARTRSAEPDGWPPIGRTAPESARDDGGQGDHPGIDPHTPQRPIWLCRTWAVDWPCLGAHSLLSVEFVTDPTGLACYLAGQLQDALADLTALNPDPGPDPVARHARFLAWVRPRVAITRAYLDGDPPPHPPG